jgi:hypothetical protein
MAPASSWVDTQLCCNFKEEIKLEAGVQLQRRNTRTEDNAGKGPVPLESEEMDGIEGAGTVAGPWAGQVLCRAVCFL